MKFGWYNASPFIPSYDTVEWDNVFLCVYLISVFTTANMVWVRTVVILSVNRRLLAVLDNPPDGSSLWGKPGETVLILELMY